VTLRSLLLRTWPEATGRETLGTGELQAAAALLGEVDEENARALLSELHRRPLTSAAMQAGNARAIAEALRWEGASPPPAEDIAARAALEAKAWGEPVHVELDTAGPEEAHEKILTVDGWMRLEEDYIPRVCTGEHGHAHPEALRAQAIAARTYVLRAMRDHRSLGRSLPIKNSQTFQVYAKAAFRTCIEAAEDTRGIVARYLGQLMICNYVAGALWKDGHPGADPTHPERFVTYNAGKTGRFVKPTGLSDKTRSDNRGCMSQNAADWFARHGHAYPEILRHFYGDDLELGQVTAAPESRSTTPTNASLPDAQGGSIEGVEGGRNPIPGIAIVSAIHWLLG